MLLSKGSFPWFIFRLKEIHQLKNRNIEQAVKSARELTKILIIDDNEVPFLQELLNHDYKIKKYDDLTDLSNAAEYDIILCDIWGVGKKLNSKHQGAHLVGELKKHYPQKQVVAFTGERTDPIISEKLLKADVSAVLPKDADIDDWVRVIDGCIKMANDPFFIWLRARASFYQQEVSAKVVAMLEHNFVTAYIKKDPAYFYNKNIEYPVNDETKKSIERFAMSAAVKALFTIL